MSLRTVVAITLPLVTNEQPRLSADRFTRWWKETGEHELRQLLHWRWDPIGVAAAFPYAAAEYDSYAPEVVSALRKGASSVEIAQLLGTIEHEQMGLGEGADERRRNIAEEILAWFESSQARWVDFGPLRR